MDLLSLLFPKEKRFYKMVEEQVNLVGDAVSDFHTLICKYHTLTPKRRRRLITSIRKREQQDDILYTHIVRELKSTFITPMDREDIQQLVGTFDSLIDTLELISLKFTAFKIRKVNGHFKKQTDILSKSYALIQKSIFSLRDESQVEKFCIQLRKLEQEADDVFIDALKELFADSVKPLDVIKLQDLHTSMEKIIDELNGVSLIIENLAVKYS